MPIPLLGKLFGSVKIPLVDQLGSIVDDLHHSGEEKAASALAIRQLEQSGVLAQLGVQKTMLGHRSIFVAGGRPALIWMCVFGIGFQVIIRPILQWIMAISAPEIIPPPALDIVDLVALVTAALGLGALRSRDKQNNVTDK